MTNNNTTDDAVTLEQQWLRGVGMHAGNLTRIREQLERDMQQGYSTPMELRWLAVTPLLLKKIKQLEDELEYMENEMEQAVQP